MNLENAVTMSQLAEPKPVKTVKEILSSTQVAYKVLARCEAGGYPYKHFPVTKDGAKAWAKKFLTSKEFQLMRINLNAAAAPHNPRDPNRVKYYIKANADEFDPLLVDVNRRKEGRTHLGYIPEVIFVDGKHRRAAMLAQGRTEHWAYVGIKAIKKMPKQLEIKASHDEIYLPPVDKSKIASQYELMCATVPAVSMPPRQDAGSGGSRPKDHLHSNKMKAGGPGSGRRKELESLQRQAEDSQHQATTPEEREMWRQRAEGHQKELNTLKSGATGDCNACGARSTGSLDPSEKEDVSPSDLDKKHTWNPDKPQIYPSGAKPGDANTFGSPPLQAPGAGVGPRVINKGASRSEMARTVTAKGKVKAAVKIKKMYTKKKKVDAGGPGSGRRPGGGAGNLTHQVVDRYHGTFFKVASGPHTKEEAQRRASRRNTNSYTDDHTWHAVPIKGGK